MVGRIKELAVPSFPAHVSGVFPHLAVTAGHVPRSETGIGALMPWAEQLWFITYPANPGQGFGHGLFSIDAGMNQEKHPQSVVGTYANRFIHRASDLLLIGPHLIDVEGEVRTVEPLVPHRLTATMAHLTDPENKVLYLTMAGLIYELDLHTLAVAQLFDLAQELDLGGVEHLHFKDAYTGQGRVFVAHNTYTERDYLHGPSQGRLSEWDGDAWTTIETCQFNAVTGRTAIDDVVFAIGADNASAILKVRAGGRWSTYRLPKGTHTQDHSWTTEWPRIREVESERWLVDASGLFYELPAMAYGGAVWGLRPICTHLRIIGDYCAWRGLLVLAGDQTTPLWDSNPFCGQPQANLWFGKTDDLWGFGRPTGWGGPWRKKRVRAGEHSDPFLMTGFGGKTLHLRHYAGRTVEFAVEVDFLGDQSWAPYDILRVPARGYTYHVFPPGFSAHWVRLTAESDCTATAYLHYT